MSIGKQALRVEARTRRAGLPAADLEAAGSLLLGALRPLLAGRVAAYASTGAEPSTAPLLAALDDVLLPVLLADGDLDWARYEGELVEGRRGTREPPGARLGRDATAGCTLVLVPALGVDRVGTRLGRGGGSYDRALRRTTAYVVAALHDGELHELLPVEAHDRPVDAVVLPSLGLVRL